MKICMISPTYPPNDVPCGVGDYTHELCEQLAVLGVPVTVVASTAHHLRPSARVKVIPFAERWDFRSVAALVRMLCREGFDLVNMQYTPELFGRFPWMKLLPACLAFRGGPRVVLTAHTLVGGYLSAKALAPVLAGFSHRIICPNDEVAYLIGRFLPFLRRRTRQIPIGSSIPPLPGDAERIRTTIRAEFGLGADTVLLTHFGFAYKGKGIQTLLSAAGRLRTAGVKYLLLMIGGPWPGAEVYYGELQALSGALGLDGHVRWLGHCSRERIATLLVASDIYVLPYDDGISARRSTLVAGIIHRLPIISTHPVRPSRLFRDGENVLLVPPGDHIAFARAVTTLIGSSDLRRRLCLGVADLAEKFSWPRIAAATVEVYREAVE